ALASVERPPAPAYDRVAGRLTDTAADAPRPVSVSIWRPHGPARGGHRGARTAARGVRAQRSLARAHVLAALRGAPGGVGGEEARTQLPGSGSAMRSLSSRATPPCRAPERLPRPDGKPASPRG